MARAPIVLGQPALQIGQLPSYAARMAPRPVIREPQPIRQETGALAATDAFDAGVMRPLGGGGIGEAAARFGEAYLTARGARENRDKEETDRINEANRENARREALAQAVASYDPSQPPQMQYDALIRALSGGAPEEALGLATGDVQQRLGQEREQTGARDQYAWQRQFDNENPEAITPYQRAQLDLSRRQIGAASSAQRAPPAGYRWTRDGNLEAVPGGPADIRATAAGQAQAGRLQSSATSLANAIQVLDRAEGMVNSNTSGIWANRAREWGLNQGATDLNEALEPVRAILSFENLAEMRRNSETGGALGSIAVRELDLLGSTIRSLSTAQSPAELTRAIQDTRTQLRTTMAAVVAAQREAAGTAGQSQPGQAPQSQQARPDPLGIR